MRIFRSQEQWQHIIKEQQDSGLTIAQYCREHQLSSTTFYTVRKKFGLKPSGFVQAKITKQVEVIEHACSIRIQVGSATVELPAATPPDYLGQVLRALV
ncbi:IS66 family insertion sequence element accessory protein TnpA [Thalassotalea sp. PS06]|uniref:IS66 family insertion sequence element accessory protein TnpA n=1 Tax=Thalassotalea sp. PS06 TaxID=2594005 RepID=UPI0011654EAF|nr:transposase [Thalassotalea sp. PS06]QDP02762.1 IS66 family insertion sequence element accessory protein TnpB [Thalassotalea sp. PS06]